MVLGNVHKLRYLGEEGGGLALEDGGWREGGLSLEDGGWREGGGGLSLEEGGWREGGWGSGACGANIGRYSILIIMLILILHSKAL